MYSIGDGVREEGRGSRDEVWESKVEGARRKDERLGRRGKAEGFRWWGEGGKARKQR